MLKQVDFPLLITNLWRKRYNSWILQHCMSKQIHMLFSRMVNGAKQTKFATITAVAAAACKTVVWTLSVATQWKTPTPTLPLPHRVNGPLIWLCVGLLEVTFTSVLTVQQRLRQRLRQRQHFSVITIGFHSINWTSSHCAAAAVAMATQVNRFQPHSVWLQLWQWQKRQWQNILHYIACYFAAATAAQCEHFGPIAAKKTLKAVAAAAPCERTFTRGEIQPTWPRMKLSLTFRVDWSSQNY